MLEDLLRSHLDLVICGTAASAKSALVGHYYAGPGNKFWHVLAQTGLTAEELRPGSYRRLLDFGIGLTDLVKGQSGSDAMLQFDRMSSDLLREKIRKYQPRYLCFNGKRAAQQYFSTKAIGYGVQAARLGTTILFVAPSTSGAANAAWDLAVWQDLADRVRRIDGAG
jgi:TDG/mug DNA glycosylase family protein